MLKSTEYTGTHVRKEMRDGALIWGGIIVFFAFIGVLFVTTAAVRSVAYGVAGMVVLVMAIVEIAWRLTLAKHHRVNLQPTN